MSIANEITRLQTAKADLKTAIENKGVTVPSSAKLDSYSTYVDSIEQGGGGGGSPVSKNDVNFIDYDGTIVNSYSAEEFASLSALPNNPDHTSEGLVSQGWNWTLSNAKTYVATYGALNIGQMYITDDGATRITIDASEWSDLSFSLTFSQDVSDGVTVNWGDGSSSETMSGTGSKTFNHTFPSRNIYTVSLLPSSNCTLTMSYSSSSGMFGSMSTYRNRYNSVYSVHIGSGVTSIGTYVFYYCYSLQSVTIPSGVTSIDTYAFGFCYSLQSVTIPSNVTSIDTYAFFLCSSLQSVSISSGVTSIGELAFYSCSALQSITIPSGVTSIGGRTFHQCSSLQSVTISSGVTSIGELAFHSCYSLQSITIPSGVTSIGGNVFYYCRCLQSLTIPSNVTSIGTYAFYSCSSLHSVTIPSNVTSIGTYAFQSCSSLNCLIFERATPPTLGGASNSLGSTRETFPIYVPDSAVSSYKSAYTNYASRIKGISERPSAGGGNG